MENKDLFNHEYIEMDEIEYRFDHKAWNQIMIGLVIANIVIILAMVL